MRIPYPIKKSNYAQHGHKVGELKKTIQGFLFHLRFFFRFRFRKASKKNIFYFVYDPSFKHPGLADRLKAIVYCYYITKQSGYSFKLIYTKPFVWADYLEPNLVDWIASPQDLEYSVADTRLFIYTARRTGINFRLTPERQYHCYCYQGDDLFYQTGHPYGQYFGELFNELFRVSPKLQAAIDASGLVPKTYISVHIRFVNALDSFERKKYPTLSESKQLQLISRCRNAIKKIACQSDMPVYVFSDSKSFLDSLSDLPVQKLDVSGIAHISHTEDERAILKTFVDWFCIANSKVVYRLLADELYQTNFSLYAALINDTKVIDYNV